MDIEIIRSKRKTIAIHIESGPRVLVRAPLRTPDSSITAVLKSKQAWILKHLASWSNRKKTVHTFTAGDMFWYLGQEYPLDFSEDYFRKPKFTGQSVVVSKFFNTRAKAQLLLWYKEAAREVLEPRLKELSEQLVIPYSSFRLTSARTRWGSCSRRGTINLSWKLIMAPQSVIDYVIIHELTHCVHHNHSKAFWQEVALVYPNWKDQRNWLNTHGWKLTV